MSDIRGEIEAAFNELSAEPDESPSSESESPSTEVQPDETTTPAPATEAPSEVAEPSETPAPPVVEKPQGPIPFQRHKEILDKTRTELETKIARLSWAEQFDPDLTKTGYDLVSRIKADPVGTLRQLQEEAKAMGLLPNVDNTPPAAPPPKEPEPDVLLEDGRMVYSHAQMQALLEFRENRMQQRFEQEVGPIKQSYMATREVEAAKARLKPVFDQYAASLPMFKESMDEMRAAATALIQSGRTPSLEQLYLQVVVPKLRVSEEQARQDERAKVLAELRAKPSSSERPVAPASLATSGSSGPRSIADILRETAAELGA